MGKVYMQGIDISEHQGNISLNKYKEQFVIIRIGYDTVLDKKAKRNMDLCEKLGIPYGVYLYSYALNVSEAKKEAEFVLKHIKNRPISVGVWFDMEDADKYKKKHGMPSDDTITKMCNEFCKTISEAGFYVGVYASESWFGTKIKASMKYPKWVANWGPNDGKRHSDKSSLGPLHQYTSKPLDKDVMYVPLSTFANKSATSIMQSKPVDKTVDELAKEVIAGKWGNGDARKKKLEKAGYNYNEVQKKVNELLAPKTTKRTAQEKMCAWAKMIADSKKFKYVKWKSSDKKTQTCPICSKRVTMKVSYNEEKNKFTLKSFQINDNHAIGGNCIWGAFSPWKHGAGIPIKCSCHTISTDTGEKMYKAKSNADALKIAQQSVGIKELKVIRNKKGIPTSEMEKGDVLMHFNGSSFEHATLYIGNGKIYDNTSGRNPNIKYGTSLSGWYVKNPPKVLVRFTGK